MRFDWLTILTYKQEIIIAPFRIFKMDLFFPKQAVFACVCVILFTHLVRRRFQLGYLESYGIYLLSLLPFTTDMPDAMTTQEIVTEGIAYAAFYLFMAVLLTAVWNKSLAGVAVLYLVTQFLAATRSQLQILFGVCGVIFFYIVLTGKGKKDCTFDGGSRSKAGKAVRIGGRILFGLAGCLFKSIAEAKAEDEYARYEQEQQRKKNAENK